MKSIQEIFSGEFENATLAVIQKLRPDERNLTALKSGFTESWPPLAADRTADMFVLDIGKNEGRMSGSFGPVLSMIVSQVPPKGFAFM